MPSRNEEINEFMLSEMKAHGWEDTVDNRLAFLEGLRDGWKEDKDDSIEKTFYMMALDAEIFGLNLKRMFSFREH